MRDYEDLVKSLRYCAEYDCTTVCPRAGTGNGCITRLKKEAADVRPVVRAAWQSWEQDKPPCKWYSCDYCGFHSLSKSNFCPNCGAKMDGGVNDGAQV